MLARIALIALTLAAAGPSGPVLSTAATAYGETYYDSEGNHRTPVSFVSHSPDGKSTVSIDSRVEGSGIWDAFRRRTRLHLSGAAGEGSVDVEQGLPVEILWSPDSSQVAISPSRRGGYDLIVMGGKRGHIVQVGQWFREQLDAPRSCAMSDVRSAGAVKWLSRSRLLVVMDTSAFDGCGHGDSTVSLFDYDLDRLAVVKTYTVKAARAAFPGALGRRYPIS